MGLLGSLNNALGKFGGATGMPGMNIASSYNPMAAAGGIGNVWGDISGANKNRAYQEKYNNMVMAREDTAAQRRKADLIAAGLSPTLAAGSTAESAGTGMDAEKAPDMTPLVTTLLSSVGGIGGMISGLIKMPHDISRTDADTAAAVATKENIEARTQGQYFDNVVKAIEARNSEDIGVVPKSSVGKSFGDLGSFVQHIADKINGRSINRPRNTPGTNNTKKIYNRGGKFNAPGSSEGSSGSW
nr:MAG: DNA pilot protein [Microviridae sp.]